MKFHELTSSHVGGRTFPWVGSYGPLNPMEKMLFLEGMPEAFRTRRLQSWEINKDLPGLEIDPGGRTWSDFIGCGGGPPSHFVSERVIHDLGEAKIPILRATEMPIAKIAAKALQKIDPPKYFILEALPGIARDWEAMGIPVDENGKPLLHLMPFPRPKVVYLRSSWNGLDLFSVSDGRQTTLLLCTDRVKDLAESKGWTNVKFDPVIAT